MQYNTISHISIMRYFFYSLLLFIALSCQRGIEYNILFENQSDSAICIGFDCTYPDDSLNVIAHILDPINPCLEIAPHSQGKLWQGIGKKESWYYVFDFSHSNYHGYISFTIMDKEVKDCGELESVQKEYNILARYDITNEDIEKLGWKLTYPPSHELERMHIWIRP